MKFEEFMKELTQGLQEIYGEDTDINTGVGIRNNGNKYNGVSIFLKGSQCRTAPFIELDSVYEAFQSGRMSLGDCIWDVYHKRETLNSSDEVERLAENAAEWELIKHNIYPILLSTEENEELLETLVSTPMLDLSVVYIIRGEYFGEGAMSIKITTKLLEYYGMSVEQLHSQAMENMEKDGYEFLEMQEMVKNIRQKEETEDEQDDVKAEMYVLTNSAMSYGAAGILNKELIKEFAGDRDFIILPSSIHETLFVPVTDETDQKFFDGMVKAVNATQVSIEERLADHSYYYDAAIGEIRMCA